MYKVGDADSFEPLCLTFFPPSYYVVFSADLFLRGRRGHDRMIGRFKTTHVISAYHH
jgi:hypothetical protein